MTSPFCYIFKALCPTEEGRGNFGSNGEGRQAGTKNLMIKERKKKKTRVAKIKQKLFMRKGNGR